MQSINDDMDELFRRAAENYPLDTKSSDWNKVAAALEGQNETKTVPGRKNNKKGRFLWLLLLLPLGLICNRFYSPGILEGDSVSKTVDAGKIPLKQVDTKQQVDFGKTTGAGTSILPGNTGSARESGPANGLQRDTDRSLTHTQFPGGGRSNAISKNNFPAGELIAQKDNTISGTGGETFLYRNYVSEIPYRQLPLAPSVNPGRALNPAVSNSPATKPVRVSRPKRLYAGLMGGIDATTIKFQKIEDAGYTFGLLLGYQINKKWSVETGAYMEKKFYYSDGEHFNTSKLNLPPNTWIEDLSGYCKMIEVPLSARYNFALRKQSTWFGVVGLTSYFMTQENYTYNYYYGTVGPVPHQKEYTNGSTNIFSNISISGGYTHRLGNFADIRVEPYIKMPLTGMGIGSVPLSSAGLQIGLTRKF